MSLKAHADVHYPDGSGSISAPAKKVSISVVNKEDPSKDTWIEFEMDQDLNEARLIVEDECVWSKLMGDS